MRFAPEFSMPVQYPRLALRAGLLASMALLAACSATPTIDERDAFTKGNTYSRNFAGSSEAACEAGRRSLLGQGYVIDKAEPNRVSGHKNYQDEKNDDRHAQIQFNIDCTSGGNGQAIVYASALRDLYTIKKSSNSASVGLSVLGAVSMPVGSSDDSLVKTSSETISRGAFYEGFFDQLAQNLASAQAAIEAGTAAPQKAQPQSQQPRQQQQQQQQQQQTTPQSGQPAQPPAAATPPTAPSPSATDGGEAAPTSPATAP
ncbi:DUF2242 domain-containing protein [Bordetella petrii]|uniref:DUF2242 domain-containing protein n=1 Tax=Bordetella petrii TaxID=94624 RepID=UPI001E3FD1B6|nr:DUF2242 domain-containing protein [Bordetella petrii]MCD0504189.1 DUF2242 domain-containing protein [Bordetella petrii]